jgi:hypothetical protein
MRIYKLRMRTAMRIRPPPFEAGSQSNGGGLLKVVTRTPRPGLLEYRFWHLLVDDSALYLCVMCEQSATSFPIMVRLTPDEYVEYHALGWTFLQYMAEKINYWASTYSARRVSNELRAAAEAVIADATERRDK